MAFKRSAVRSRLSPPKSIDSTLNRCLFLTFFVFLFCWVNEKVNRISRFCPLCRRKAVKMAYIQEKLKGKKIVSFKFKACVGRDDNGKQIFKCTTWYPPAELTPAKARKEAQKVAAMLFLKSTAARARRLLIMFSTPKKPLQEQKRTPLSASWI